MTRISITVAAVLLPSVAAAHPEHFSGGDFGLAHYLKDPFHVGLTCAAIFLVIVAWRSVRRRFSVNRRAP